MKKHSIISLALLFVLFACVGCVTEENKKPEEPYTVQLTTDGTSDYRIVIAADATDPYKNAASELQKYVKLVTGAEWAIVTDSEAKTDKEIVIGQTNRGTFGVDFSALGSDAFKIFSDKDTVVIAGGKRGSIYGVYEFLRRVFGVGFYSRDCEIIPSTPTVTVQSDFRIEAEPFFKERMSYGAFYDENDVVTEADRMKFGMTPRTEAWGGKDEIAANNFDMHTINYLLNNSELAKYHTYNKQPCVSCDENYNKILETALAWIARRDGKCTYINISQNDGPGGWCTCDLCTNYNNLYAGGKPSGSWWYFINRIADDIHKQYPDVEIRTYAYEDTTDLVSLDLGHKISAYVSTGNPSPCCNHPLTECDSNLSSGIADTVRAWGEKLDKIYIYEYFNCSGEFNMTFPNLFAMRENYRFYADNNVYGVIPFGTRDVAADFVVLRYYLFSRLLWNPYVSEEEYQAWIDEFCTAYYGKESGKYIVDFIKLFDQTFADRDIRVDYGYKIENVFSLPALKNESDYRLPENGAELAAADDLDSILQVSNVLATDYLDRAHALFDSALAAAENDEMRDRIELASLQVEYHEIYLYYGNQYKLRNYLDLFNRTFGTNYGKATTMLHWYDMNIALSEKLKALGAGELTESRTLEDGKTFYESNLPREWVRS